MVKNTNYINIQGWMVNELELSGNELICYALIYGFCQDGRGVFSGGVRYIAEWLNISERSVFDILKRLSDRCYIEKKNNQAGKPSCYICCPVYNFVDNPVDNSKEGGEESSGVGMKKLQGGYEETSPNNNIYNNNLKNNKINNQEVDFFRAEKTKQLLEEQMKKKWGV